MQRADYFRANLRTALAGVSQRSFAEKAGMKHPYLNRVLQGHTIPGIDQCDKLADAIGIPLELLLLPPEDFATKFENVTELVTTAP